MFNKETFFNEARLTVLGAAAQGYIEYKDDMNSPIDARAELECAFMGVFGKKMPMGVYDFLNNFEKFDYDAFFSFITSFKPEL